MAKKLRPETRVKRLIARTNKKEEVFKFRRSNRGVPMGEHIHESRVITFCWFGKTQMFGVFLDGKATGSAPTEKVALELIRHAWLDAHNKPRIYCDRCSGRGEYWWGAIHNGVPTHTGPCFRCASKGWLSVEDQRRNYGYDMHLPAV